MSKFPKIYVALMICANFSNVNAIHSIQSETCNSDLQYSFPFEYLDQNCDESRFEHVDDVRFEDYNEIIDQFDQSSFDIALNARSATSEMKKNKSLAVATEQEVSEIFNVFEYSAFVYVLTSNEVLEKMQSANTIDKQIIEKLKHNNHLIETKLQHVRDLLQQLYSATANSKLASKSTFVD